MADEIGVKAYIADPVVVDEMMPYARISGMPELPRESVFHALNQKAVARLFAKETGKRYEDLNLVVCHMGGGCTVSAHRRGRVIDTTNALDGCGPISPERSGSLPPGPLIRLCFSGKYTEEELIRKVHGQGGLMAHLGTTSVPEVLDRILAHDLHAMLILRAMCYSIAKEIGAMSVALKGNVDAILLTGGIAHSKRVTDFIADHVDYIAPIYVYPGENELRALASNALEVLRGERQAKPYVSEENEDPSQINDTTRPSKLRDWLLGAISPQAVNAPVSSIRHYMGKWR
ncbi:MAG: butyrate kinase, partial [Muribaculaceae bacterium]|nr:butyrate kinase [Muribaculaceae bacterium]